MAITDYAQLQAAAANWLVRADLTARIPEFITLAEARLNRVLRARLAEAEVQVSLAAGARAAPLPAGFAEALQLWRVTAAGRESLAFLEPSLLGVSSLRGEPCAWTVDGGQIAFDRPALQGADFVLRMLRRFALSEAQPTNGLLADAPDVYLFATLCEAAPFLRDEALAGAYEAKLQRAIGELNGQDARARAARTLRTELPALTLARAI
jgi:hypothetical protein